MSVKVTSEDIEKRLDEYGNSAFVVTVDADFKIKVVNSSILSKEDFLICAPGQGTLSNLKHNSSVTLIFQPHTEGGFSLIIDGDGEVLDPEEGTIKISFNNGVLHRPA